MKYCGEFKLSPLTPCPLLDMESRRKVAGLARMDDGTSDEHVGGEAQLNEGEGSGWNRLNLRRPRNNCGSRVETEIQVWLRFFCEVCRSDQTHPHTHPHTRGESGEPACLCSTLSWSHHRLIVRRQNLENSLIGASESCRAPQTHVHCLLEQYGRE